MTSARGDGATDTAFVAGDESALAEVYARWSPLVYSLALRSLGDVTAAEEVTQRVFTQAWASRETFDPARTRLADWLVDLACRSVAAARAAGGVRPAPTDLDEFGVAESKTGVLAERLSVADEMSHLDTSSRRVLQMALDHDLTLGEIAGRTGLRVEEVRSRIATTLMQLRQRLEGNADAH